MSGAIEIAGKWAGAIGRIGRAVGPYLIAQSKTVSENVAEHQNRLARSEAFREMILSEARSIAAVRAALRKRLYAASEEERVLLRRDIEEVEREGRKLLIYEKALDQLPPPESDQSGDSAAEKEIEPHWIDRFNEYARAVNEPWRADLLAKALAREAEAPGSVGPRGLWFIGTAEERIFHAFAAVLDISTYLVGEWAVPGHQKFREREVPTSSGNQSFGSLMYQLGSLGLFGDYLTTQSEISKGSNSLVLYDSTGYAVAPKEPLIVHGIIPSELGTSLARLYRPKPNSLGQEIFDTWIASLDKAKFPISPAPSHVIHEVRNRFFDTASSPPPKN